MDIGTETQIKQLLKDEYFAGLVAGLLQIIQRQGMLIGILLGILCVGVVVTAYGYYDTREELKVLQLQINNLRGIR